MRFQGLFALLALVASTLGDSNNGHPPPPTKTSPCAIVSASWAAQISATPTASPTVAASLAHECLNSVPLGASEALALMEAIGPYLEFQSDTAVLKDPPSTYFYPPFDVFGKYASIIERLEHNFYANEYEFQKDLFQLFIPAHDGHFLMLPDLLSKAFYFARQRSLVSISRDGSQIPEIYLYEDITSSPSSASVVRLINGIDASTYVAEWIYAASINQDPDAAYNTMFFEKAFSGEGSGNGFFSSNGPVKYIYPGPETTFTFENGTHLALDNIAYIQGNFSGVTDGPSFYKVFCNSTTEPAPATPTPTTPVTTVPILRVPGYPSPVIGTKDLVVSGYYLDGEGFEDVAVISVFAFVSESPLEFQAVGQEFFANAVTAGKKKLVIDLSANGGGLILQGFDLFRQLFPHTIQEDYTRMRENEYFLAMAEIISDTTPANYDPNTASAAIIEDTELFLNYRHDYNFTEQPFETFADKFAPYIYKGDSFTQLIRWNLNDPLTTSNLTFGFGADITGYGNRTNLTQPFAAEDIILLYDGYCGSTCTIFSEFMRLQGGVKSIAMGGRPNKNAIQGVGGIKGAQNLAFQEIQLGAQLAIAQTTDTEKIATLSKLLSPLPLARSTAAGINLRDNILPGNVHDGLPAQYVIEEADCRLFYTLDMVNDVQALWKGAANAAWNGGRCVAGKGLGKKHRGSKRDQAKMKSSAQIGREMAQRREVFKKMERTRGTDPLFRLKYGGEKVFS